MALLDFTGDVPRFDAYLCPSCHVFVFPLLVIPWLHGTCTLSASRSTRHCQVWNPRPLGGNRCAPLAGPRGLGNFVKGLAHGHGIGTRRQPACRIRTPKVQCDVMSLVTGACSPTIPWSNLHPDPTPLNPPTLASRTQPCPWLYAAGVGVHRHDRWYRWRRASHILQLMRASVDENSQIDACIKLRMKRPAVCITCIEQ